MTEDEKCPAWAVRLKSLRENRGWSKPRTARALFQAAGISQPTKKQVESLARQIRSYERGEHFPRDWVDAYATMFGQSPPELFGPDLNTYNDRNASVPSLLDLLSLAWTVGRLDQAVDRRTVLQLATTLAVAPALGFADSIERCAAALTRPTGVSEDHVTHLEARTVGFHRLEFMIPADQIFRGLLAHLNELTSLLEADSGGRWRRRLARAAGESAVLGAWLAWDLGDTARATGLYNVARLASDESDDPAIRVCSAIYQSFATSASGTHGTAHRALVQAEDLLPAHGDLATCAWLLGRKAEEAAALGDPAAREMIKEASELLAAAQPHTERSWTRCLESPHLSHMRLTIATRLGDEDAVHQGVERLVTQAGDPAQKKTGRLLASIGLALVEIGDIEEGIRFGERSVEAVNISRASYAMNRLTELGDALHEKAAARSEGLRERIRATRSALVSPRPSRPDTTPALN